jgi:hypothetical protein
MVRQVIFGVFDKSYNQNSYFGFFKYEDDAKKELVYQMNRMKEETGEMELMYRNDRVIKVNNDTTEEIVMIIHPFILR